MWRILALFVILELWVKPVHRLVGISMEYQEKRKAAKSASTQTHTHTHTHAHIYLTVIVPYGVLFWNFFFGVRKSQFLWQWIVLICSNYIYNIPIKCTYTIEYICYQRSPTCFGVYCAIFRENSVACSKLLLRCLIRDLKLYYTWVFNWIYSYLKTHIWFKF